MTTRKRIVTKNTPAYLSRAFVSDVERHGEDEALGVVVVVVHGPLVPNLVRGLVVHLAEVPGHRVRYCSSSYIIILQHTMFDSFL